MEPDLPEHSAGGGLKLEARSIEYQRRTAARAQVTAQTIGAAKKALDRAKRSTMAGGIAALIPVHVPQRFESR